MQETPQQYMQRILGYTDGKEPLRVQRATAKKLAALTKRLNKKQLARRPAPGKWSITEILAHLADTELVAGWRLRLILSQNGTPIPAFDQDVWADTFNYGRRDPKVSLETFRVLRQNNLALLKSVPKNLWENYGMHEERGRETVTHVVRMFAWTRPEPPAASGKDCEGEPLRAAGSLCGRPLPEGAPGEGNAPGRARPQLCR